MRSGIWHHRNWGMFWRRQGGLLAFSAKSRCSRRVRACMDTKANVRRFSDTRRHATGRPARNRAGVSVAAQSAQRAVLKFLRARQPGRVNPSSVGDRRVRRTRPSDEEGSSPHLSVRNPRAHAVAYLGAPLSPGTCPEGAISETSRIGTLLVLGVNGRCKGQASSSTRRGV